MLEEAVTYPPRDGYPLFLTAKRYWIPEFEIHAEDPEAWTLILLHSTASHKESWGPTLERLFHCAGRDNSVKILTCDKYAEAIYHFLVASPDYGAKVDFRKRRLYGFDSITIVDPMLSPAGSHHLNKLRTILIKGAYERRDVWPDRVTAMKALRRRDRTKKWDPRILVVFIKHGIRPHPGSYYLENPYLGVTLACTRDQEALEYKIFF
ncbi:hypothetical protein F5890DRAFT_1655088 [Lentinula detonsa]|uniref:Uncharacterized protein n=1 Tax=Lentinula detonsa TaxID=2804962 RepID=A0AA38ULY0_9AGAR|nr:hypothetical protein F5890DRAFT_1655088 [Lentinula detonsa]